MEVILAQAGRILGGENGTKIVFEFFTADKRQKSKEPREAHMGLGKAHLHVEDEKDTEQRWRTDPETTGERE